MPGNFVDLHTHSMASDGTDRPGELVKKAAALGLAAVALTDHDTLEGLAEAEAAASGLGIAFIRGCELAVQCDDGELHLLGLWVPEDSRLIASALKAAREQRTVRNAAIVEKLQGIGIPITLQDIAACSRGEAVGRPHIAHALIRMGCVESPAEAFERYLGQGGAAFVPRVLHSPEEGIRLLAEEGATVILAHPCLKDDMTRERLDALLADFRTWGLSGIEAYHSAHSHAAVRTCLALAERHRLLLSGGSDYHGGTKPGIGLGQCGHGIKAPFRMLEAMREYRRQRGLWV